MNIIVQILNCPVKNNFFVNISNRKLIPNLLKTAESREYDIF